MPELPEVEIMVRDLADEIPGRTFTHVETTWDRMVVHPSPTEFRQQLTGRTVRGVRRRGKYAIFDLDTGDLFILHRGMSGSLLLRPQTAPDDRFVRARFQLDDGRELRFDDARKFGRLYLIDPKTDECRLPWSTMGPEPLDPLLTPAGFRARLAGRRARVKGLLLNQGLLAGVGNIYADEALFRAGIHPERSGGSLSEEEVVRLLRAVRDVLDEGIAARGTTFSTYRDVDGRSGDYQHHLWVFGRSGLPCLTCGTEIRKIVVGGRGTHFCPACQR